MDIIYSSSGLFRVLQKAENDINSIKNVFHQKIGENYFSKKKIFNLLNNYDSINYSKA